MWFRNFGFDPVDLEMTLVVNNGYCGSASDSVGEFLFTLTFEPPIPPAENPFGCFDGSGNTNLLFLRPSFCRYWRRWWRFHFFRDTLSFSLIESFLWPWNVSCWQEAINSWFDSCVVLSINQINDSACLDGGCDGLGGLHTWCQSRRQYDNFFVDGCLRRITTTTTRGRVRPWCVEFWTFGRIWWRNV